jgi:hypothetical protein
MEKVQAMNSWNTALRSSVRIGGLTGLATAVTAALCGWRESNNAVAPLNAISHIVWGEEATAQEQVSAKYTATGLVLNISAMFGWAFVFAAIFGGRQKSNRAAVSLSGGVLVSILAYIVDYHVVPKRLTPGIEARLSARSLLAVYSVLALSLGLGGLMTAPEDD